MQKLKKKKKPSSLTRKKILINYLVRWAGNPTPPGTQGLIMLTPVKPSCYLTISQLKNCAQADLRPCKPSPSPGFLKCFARSLGILGQGRLVSLQGLEINISLFQTTAFQFVWLCCVFQHDKLGGLCWRIKHLGCLLLGIGTCVCIRDSVWGAYCCLILDVKFLVLNPCLLYIPIENIWFSGSS